MPNDIFDHPIFNLHGYEVHDWNQGFKTTWLNSIAAYVAVKRPAAYGFAFAVSGIQISIHQSTMTIEEFTAKALETLEAQLQSNNLINRKEYTFEYDFGQDRFVEVANASWWISTSQR